MHRNCSSDKAKHLIAKRRAIYLASMLALVIDMEVVKTAVSILATQNKCLNNVFSCPIYDTNLANILF